MRSIFLELLIEALEGTDKESIETTVDNLLTFVAAGYEPRQYGLLGGLYLLGDASRRLQGDVRDRRLMEACGAGPIGFEDLPKMPKTARLMCAKPCGMYPAGALYRPPCTEEVRKGL